MPLFWTRHRYPLDKVLAGAFEPLGWTASRHRRRVDPVPLTWPGWSTVQVSTPPAASCGCGDSMRRRAAATAAADERHALAMVLSGRPASCAPRTRSGWRAGTWRGRLYCSGSGRPPPLTLPLAPFCTSGRSGPRELAQLSGSGAESSSIQLPIPGSGRRSSAGLYRSPRSSVGAFFAVARSPTKLEMPRSADEVIFCAPYERSGEIQRPLNARVRRHGGNGTYRPDTGATYLSSVPPGPQTPQE